MAAVDDSVFNPFRDFIVEELGRRLPFFTATFASYDGNPNAAAAPALLDNAIPGTVYERATPAVLYDKTATGAGNWEPRSVALDDPTFSIKLGEASTVAAQGVALGYQAIGSEIGDIVIGYNAATADYTPAAGEYGTIVIGQAAGSFAQTIDPQRDGSVAIGARTELWSSKCLAIGTGSVVGQQSSHGMALGYLARVGTNGTAATGAITAIPGGGLIDGETFVLNDGIHSAVTFEFDDDLSVTETTTLRRVLFNAGMSDVQVATAIVTAIGSAPVLNMIGDNTGGTSATVDLDNTNNPEDKIAGNQTITETVAHSGFIVTGMAGGAAPSVGNRSVAIGPDALTVRIQAVALGTNASAMKDYGVAIGRYALANAFGTIALGPDATSVFNFGIAIGSGATSTHAESVALGKSAVSTAENRFTIGSVAIPMAVQTFGELGVGVAPGTAMAHIQANTAATIGAIVQGAASQTANLQEWQTSTGAQLAIIDSNGNLDLTFPAQYLGANVGTSSFVGMRMPSAGVVELHANNQKLLSLDSIRALFTPSISWPVAGSVAGSQFETIKNSGAGTLYANEVVVMSGATREVQQSASANQRGVVVAIITANVGANTRIADRGIFEVWVEALEVVAPGDTLVSSATAGTAQVDNTETDPAKIVGYAWESKTVGATRETTLFRVI